MKRTTPRRNAPEVNAGSMADIAFLLLIFFLVTTTIMSDKGILVKLPPWSIDQPEVIIKQRNVMRIAINANDQILLRDQQVDLAEVRELIMEFIVNPDQDPTLAEASNKAVISLINDRGTQFESYLQVYNELKGAYNELWEAAAQRRFGDSYYDLPLAHQRSIRNEIPLVISEAEPTDHGLATLDQ